MCNWIHTSLIHGLCPISVTSGMASVALNLISSPRRDSLRQSNWIPFPQGSKNVRVKQPRCLNCWILKKFKESIDWILISVDIATLLSGILALAWPLDIGNSVLLITAGRDFIKDQPWLATSFLRCHPIETDIIQPVGCWMWKGRVHSRWTTWALKSVGERLSLFLLLLRLPLSVALLFLLLALVD